MKDLQHDVSGSSLFFLVACFNKTLLIERKEILLFFLFSAPFLVALVSLSTPAAGTLVLLAYACHTS